MKKEVFDICISQLETSSLSAKDTEDTWFSVIFELLGKEGYEFKHAPSSAGNDGVDFIAKKVNAPEKIGISYKQYQGAVGTDAVSKIIGDSYIRELDRILILSNTKFTKHALDISERIYPASVELIDIDILRSWISRLKKTEEYDFKIVNIIRQELSDKLARLIASNPIYLLEIEWRELERIVQTTFEELGFSSEITPGSKDGGKDVILKCKIDNVEHTYFVELKHWRSGQKVGGSATKEFLKVIVNEQINGGLFLSTYGFCGNAFEMLTTIERQKLRFGGEQKIVSLCKQYEMSKSGIWSPSECLIDTLFHETT